MDGRDLVGVREFLIREREREMSRWERGN